MATKVYDVVAITGEYKDADGNMKPRFLNCGVVMETDKGMKLKLECVPIGGEGWFQLYEPRSKGENWNSQATGGRSNGSVSDSSSQRSAPIDDGIDF